MPKEPVIYTLCADPKAAERAVEGLRRAGVKARDIAVISSEPFEGHKFFQRNYRTPMPWLAAFGGAVGGVSGYLLAALTQRSYPLPTGNMPCVAFWPAAVLVNDRIRLGAILTTVLTLLISAGLPNWRKQIYDREVSDGMILVGVTNLNQESRIEVNSVLKQASGGPVKEFGA